MNKAFEKILEELDKLREIYDDIASIEMSMNGHNLDFEYNKGKKDVMLEVKQIVQKVSEEYNNGWIPCSERLPEDNGVYFVTLDDDVMPRCIGIRNFRNGKFEQRFIVSPLQDKYPEEREVAWMPLPEPYNGDCSGGSES